MNTRTATVLLVTITMLCNAACTTMRPVSPTREAALAHDIAPGDDVKLRYVDKTERRISVTALTDNGIRGYADDGSIVEARWGELHEIEVRRVSAGRTAGVALATVGATVLIIGAALESAGPGFVGY